MLKIKLNKTPSAPPAESDNPPSSQPAAPAKPALKLKLGSSASVPQVGDATATTDGAAPVKQKRKYTKKPKVDEDGNPIVPAPKGPGKGRKRTRDDGDESVSPVAKRKSKGDALPRTGDNISVSAPALAPKITLKTRPTTELLKIKHRGKPPTRPPGVGYDSEAEEAEEDPAVESQFVLRMQPGPDCDTLRKAIEEKTIGRTERQGGPGVWIRFFDREGRRSVVSIKGHMYAAVMVDLPCVIESMKSWDKKTWVKAADVCQMLVVLGPIKSEDEAKNYEIKTSEIDPTTYEYAHGLTPPMHWVRKRRFRPRTSYRKIEEVEEAVEKLMAADREAKEAGGRVEWEMIDPNQMESSDEASEDEEDEEMAYEGEYPEGDGVDADEMERMMMEQLGQDDNEDAFGDSTGVATSHDVAMHALGPDANGAAAVGTPASTSNAETESADENDNEAESDDEDDIDEDALAAQQELAQQREEIAELEKELQSAQQQYNQMQNVVFKQRALAKIKMLQNDLNLKKAQIGEDVD